MSRDRTSGTRAVGRRHASLDSLQLASAAQAPAASVERLLRDPSLRNNERSKGMLRLLHANALGAEHLADVAGAVPPHCVTMVALLARQYARMWQDVAQELDGRSRIIDPSATTL